MTRPHHVEFHPQAVIEAREARLWYARRDRRVASAFVAELEHAIEVIAEAPERWPLFQRDIRRYVLRRYPFSIVYRLRSEVIDILAVAHARRRPGYWSRRQ